MKTVRVTRSIQYPIDLYSRLEDYARCKGRSVTATVMIAVEKFLEDEFPEPKEVKVKVKPEEEVEKLSFKTIWKKGKLIEVDGRVYSIRDSVNKIVADEDNQLYTENLEPRWLIRRMYMVDRGDGWYAVSQHSADLCDIDGVKKPMELEF